MAEAVGVASAVITLVSAAYTSCRTLYETLGGIRDTPMHIHSISGDLEDFYCVLGTIQAILDDPDSAPGLLLPTTSENLTRVLKNSLTVFSDVSMIIQSYTTQGNAVNVSAWQRLKWTFKEKEIDDLRKSLLAHKMTLNMAISVANLYNVGTSNIALDRIEAELLELQEKLPDILQQLEDVKENQQVSQVQAHADIDRATISIDYGFALRHYLDDAASVVTSMAPSIQVSTFDASNSGITSMYRTARTHRTSEPGMVAIPEQCTQLFIRDLATIKTLVIHVEPDDDIESVKDNIRRRIKLPRADFRLTYTGRILAEHATLLDCDIAHNSTLNCISFRGNVGPRDGYGPAGTVLDQPCSVEGLTRVDVKTVDGETYTIPLNQQVAWADLTSFVGSKVCDEIGLPLSQARFIHAGREIYVGHPIGNPVFKPDGSINIYVVFRLAPENTPNTLTVLPTPEPPKPVPPSSWKSPLRVPLFPTRRRFFGTIKV